MKPIIIKIFVTVTAPHVVSELFMPTSEANPKFAFWGVGGGRRVATSECILWPQNSTVAKQITPICSWLLGNAHKFSWRILWSHVVAYLTFSQECIHTEKAYFHHMIACRKHQMIRDWVFYGNFLAFVVVWNVSLRRRPPPDLPTCFNLVTKVLAAGELARYLLTLKTGAGFTHSTPIYLMDKEFWSLLLAGFAPNICFNRAHQLCMSFREFLFSTYS